MGNNDSLPPPPPPGGQRDLPPTQATPVPPPPPAAGFPGASGVPAPPPAPPAVPQFPDAAPTTQMPPTQAYPISTPAGAGAVPPGTPPPTGVPPASDGNNKLPWIIAGAVTVVSVIVVAIVLLTGDDKTSSSPTTESVAVSTTVVASTTVAPQTTLVITTPSTTVAAPTTAPTPDTTEPGVSVFTDDTNTFTVLLLDTFETDTTPIDQDGTQIANVTGATDIAAFSKDDDHDTFGISVSAGPSDQMPSAAELLASADPGDTVCTDRTSKPGYPTLNGDAEVLLLDGCGTDGQSAKVVMVLTFPDRNLTLAVYAQGPGPSNTDLLDFTQAVTESVVFL